MSTSAELLAELESLRSKLGPLVLARSRGEAVDADEIKRHQARVRELHKLMDAVKSKAEEEVKKKRKPEAPPAETKEPKSKRRKLSDKDRVLRKFAKSGVHGKAGAKRVKVDRDALLCFFSC